MPERPIHLDLRSSSGAFDPPLNSPGQHRGETPDRDTLDRFRHALHEPESQTLPSAEPLPLPSPFELHRAMAPTAPSQVLTTLNQMVQQLSVGEGLDGRRTLRVQINPEVMPGVSVTVTEDAGAWVAEFECHQEDSFLRLARPAQEMALRLAQMLSQDAVWRVTALNLPSGGMWQDCVQSHLERPGMEAFASAPGGVCP